MSKKTKVVLVQLGSPKSPSTSDVREYLREFLGDPRVVDINPLVWKVILNCFVLPFRPKRSAKLYSRIWDGQSFPLITITEAFAKKVQSHLDPETIEINHAFLLSSPRIKDVWDDWEKDVREENSPATELIAIAMFPQYSESTVASGMDAFAAELKNRVLIPPFEFLTDFHRSKAFIDNSVQIITEKFGGFRQEGKSIDAFVISFHGIPKRRVIEKEDQYFNHCFETFYLIKQKLVERGLIEPEQMHMTFQSRFGREEWLTPYTDDYVEDLVKAGNTRIAVYCPSFVADCLETIDEIGHELQEEVEPHGGEILFVPCLNDRDDWCRDFADFVKVTCEGDREARKEASYDVPKEAYKEAPKLEYEESRPLSPVAKKSLKIVFLVLFLDLVGFSIIFPLFPALAQYYLEVDSQNFFLQLIFNSIHTLFGAGAVDLSKGLTMQSIVLFGGALGALYSVLQFVAAPLWGGISDRIGRRPVLMITMVGLALSYFLWGIAGSFTLLILARFLGGIMSGNISTATAVVADVTSRENRSKGMATIGIAFALGFIIGPAMGGVFSLINLLDYFPGLERFGVNPFSVPAFVAFALSVLNIYLIAKYFKETLPKEAMGKVRTSERIVNPLKLFKPLPYPGINFTNMSNFLFITAFSGMEFTLTFLAVERLNYSPFDNAKMFIFIGLILILVQGGYVRRKANQVGEKKMALRGMMTIVPGLLIIAYAQSTLLLYFGLFFLSVGSSLVIPCLVSLVSLYSPAESQGKAIGVYRSLGALGRVFGPLLASLLYWQYGSALPYILGALFLLIPIFMVASLPRPPKKDQTEEALV